MNRKQENWQGRGNGEEYLGSVNVEPNIGTNFWRGKEKLGCVNRIMVSKIKLFWVT